MSENGSPIRIERRISGCALVLSCSQQFIVAYHTIDGKSWTRPIVDETRANRPWDMATVHSKERS